MANLRPDLKIIRGDSRSIKFELTDNNVAVDLTGTTVFFAAKPALVDDPTDTTAVIDVTVTDHSSGDPTNGITYIPLSSTDTNVTPGNYYYDIQIKKVDDTIVSIPARMLEVSADVKRATS